MTDHAANDGVTAIGHAATLRQREAADGTASVWVAASAGTGKTKVLTDRLLALLLAGNEPARILCLTFTKAAAAEMAIRLNGRLARWAIADDMVLRADIADILGTLPDGDVGTLLDRARRLFARVLDVPGGMRILTLHAFCQSILRRFPLEAGLPPQFDVMDDRTAQELLRDAQGRILNQARMTENDAVAAALRHITSLVNDEQFAQLLLTLTQERGKIARLLEAAGGIAPYLARLARILDVDPRDHEAGLIAAACDEMRFQGMALRRAADLLLTGEKTDRARGAAMADWLAAAPDARVSGFDAYCQAFLTKEGTPRASLVTKKLKTANPDLEPCLSAEADRLVRLKQKLAATIVYEASAALTQLAAAFLAAYATEKHLHNLLDYDDLILATRDLLARPGIAPWVLFKLDGGLDHILIDEAQDTNPDQWSVVAALAEEFFTGESARPSPRTVFAVGDAKQSIFSFQRADPEEFLKMQRHFQAKAEGARQFLRNVPLDVSFRSTDAVLTLVDAVFSQEAARDGVALDGNRIQHHAYRAGQSGRVELWPLERPEETEEPEPWAPPLDHAPKSAPHTRLARRIAETIAQWCQSGTILTARNRPIRPGDIMILVRRRGVFVNELLRCLKRLDVPVAGADRMVLSHQLPVMDLIALGHFLLMPEDDLALATLLKSPLVGFDDAMLEVIAVGRPGTVWRALKSHESPWAETARAHLTRWLARVDYLSPYELYGEILGADRGREKLLGRLGTDAADAIDEFLAQCLIYERTHVPSLQGFLHWLEAGAEEVKRDFEQSGRDEVRIMTVHGSKGLQAPIVFLPDTTASPAQLPMVLWSSTKEGACLLWAPSRAVGEPISALAKAVARQKRDQEYRRLLYVALTRAEDRLYVSGWTGKKEPAEFCWFHLIETALLPMTGGVLSPIVGYEKPGLIYETSQTAPFKPSSTVNPDENETLSDVLPQFAQHPPAPEPSPPKPLVPSKLGGDDPPAASPLAGMADKNRYQRGTLIHRLLQSLPQLPPPARLAAARHYLALPNHDLSPSEQQWIADETMAVLNHHDFAPLFGPESRAEVDVAGLVDHQAFAGRVDRLLVTDREILIVDYKTNRPPPRLAADVPASYRAQLGAYRAALSAIYPHHLIRTFLLWTDGPFILEISP